MTHHVYLALGANLGDRLHAMRAAAARLGQMPDTEIKACSDLYETSPVGGPHEQPHYLNAVLKIETRRRPHDLLATCLQIERDLGRQRLVPGGPRTIDIDILLYDDEVFLTNDLIVPHPRMHMRRFVLQPLADIDPDLRHPEFGVSIRELIDRLDKPFCGTVHRISDFRWVLPG